MLVKINTQLGHLSKNKNCPIGRLISYLEYQHNKEPRMLRKKLKEFDIVNAKKKQNYSVVQLHKKVNTEQAPVNKLRGLWILLTLYYDLILFNYYIVELHSKFVLSV